MSINPVFHPYAGMIRIRLEGIISARNRGHPLKSAAKVQIIIKKEEFMRKIYPQFVLFIRNLRIISPAEIKEINEINLCVARAGGTFFYFFNFCGTIYSADKTL